MDSYIVNGSFKFGSVDMYERFGIKISNASMPGDNFLPALRPRKVEIPNRNGQYDYGAHYYKERQLVLSCVVPARSFDTELSLRSFAREIAYTLSKKDEIRIWNEPDKYYIGRIYSEIALEQIRNGGHTFNITFVCDPFAYGATKTEQMPSLVYIPEYKGTAPTPTYIVIENIGETAAVNIQITQTIRKEVY